MMAGPIRRIVILGGGTAGWMAAAALSRTPGCASCSVHLVESEELGTIGVGEATIPSIQVFNKVLGIDEREFMRATHATFKLGIEFEGWGEAGSRYFHPFGRYGVDFGMLPFHQHWLRMHSLGEAAPLQEYCVAWTAARAARFARPSEDARSALATYTYAYHFDAGQYAAFLRTLAERSGVVRTEGRVVDVVRRPADGHVERLRLADGLELEGDLFIDCSGFRSVLLGGALGCPFEDWSRWLPCDRAVALPSTRTAPLLPYTRSIAHAEGWQWRIPLQHRTGNGLVYSSALLGDEQAAQRLRAAVEGEPLGEARTIRFKAGRRAAAWVGNCVAIGLSAGFLEPLESTSIHLIQAGITRLVDWFPDLGFDAATVRRYNLEMQRDYEQARDFIILHYHANARADSALWREAAAMGVPGSLAERIELFRAHGRLAIDPAELFQRSSWLAVLLGQGIVPRQADPLVGMHGIEQVRGALRGILATAAAAGASLPDHARFLGQEGLAAT